LVENVLQLKLVTYETHCLIIWRQICRLKQLNVTVVLSNISWIITFQVFLWVITCLFFNFVHHAPSLSLLLLTKKLLSLKPVVRTRRSYKTAGLRQRQKSLQGLALYGHEVLMSLQTRAKLLIRDTFYYISYSVGD
jgi:hypothetical protein